MYVGMNERYDNVIPSFFPLTRSRFTYCKRVFHVVVSGGFSLVLRHSPSFEFLQTLTLAD